MSRARGRRRWLGWGGIALACVCLTVAASPVGSERWSATQAAPEAAPGLAPVLPASVAGRMAQRDFDPLAAIGVFEGVPYRRDGTVSDSGDFAEWEHLNRVRKTPGLNCSGHVLAGARLLSDTALTIEAARWDRNGDSHPGAPKGQDWDFGWDVVVNVALAAAQGDEHTLTYFDSHGEARPFTDATPPVDAEKMRGFSVWDSNAWQRALSAMEADRFYLGSFSRVSRRGRMVHHHTVLFVVNGPDIWVQGASPNNPIGPRVQSLLASDPAELGQLLTQFKNYRSEHVLILGAPLALSRMQGPG